MANVLPSMVAVPSPCGPWFAAGTPALLPGGPAAGFTVSIAEFLSRVDHKVYVLATPGFWSLRS